MSSRNPFRKPASSEGEVAVVPPSLPQRTSSPIPPPPLPRRVSSPIPPQSGPSSLSALPIPSSHEAPPDISSTPRIAESIDDPPPPYTPAASAREETIGLGPLRPFQPPPIPPLFHPPQESRYQSNLLPTSIQPHPTGLGSSYGPHMQPESRSNLAPWQTQQQYRQRQNAGGGLLGVLFDTVRDIADVVSGTHDERMMASQRGNAGAYSASYSSTGAAYVPPSGSLGQMHRPSPPRSSTPTVPDDGSPTRTPVPGHPLLRSGELLVYPKDHWCVKCKNTGYKNYDPSTPCRKCWEKYGKSYTGPLTYTPWSSSGSDPRMQRPLPKFLPPHLARPSPTPAPPPQHPQRSGFISQPVNMHSQGSGSSYYVVNPLSPWDSTPPVPHAIAVFPGDPRMGGRLCMRCGGEGVRTMLLFDVTCEDCGGTGRIWR